MAIFEALVGGIEGAGAERCNERLALCLAHLGERNHLCASLPQRVSQTEDLMRQDSVFGTGARFV